MLASLKWMNEGKKNKWARALMKEWVTEWMNKWINLQNEGVECNDVMNEGKKGKMNEEVKYAEDLIMIIFPPVDVDCI